MYDRGLKSIDAITAMIINTQTGLNLLRAQSPNLEELRQVLDGIADGGKRAGFELEALRATSFRMR
jgi:hypothetical protein